LARASSSTRVGAGGLHAEHRRGLSEEYAAREARLHRRQDHVLRRLRFRLDLHHHHAVQRLGLAALGYKAANPDFPDQTTADQFFDEAQFEAYRHLGYSVGEAVLKDTECLRILRRRTGLAT
jgi:hypothetical protein